MVEISEEKDYKQRIAKPNIERSILSICLQDSDKYIEIKNHDVNGNMFLIDANKYIFFAIEYLFSKQQTPSPISVLEVITDNSAKIAIEAFGGIEYLSLLMEQRINSDNIPILCEKLKQAYTRNQMYLICEESQEYILSSKTEVLNPAEIINSVENKILELSNTVQQTKEIYKMGDDAEEILKIRSENPNSIPGLQIGFPQFDYHTNGGQAGDLIMICARAKTGKSTLLTNWATKLAIKDKLPVLYFDTEMDARQQEDRILSILSGVPHKEIVSGMYVLDTEHGNASDKIKAVKSAIEELKNGNYYHIYMPSFTIDKVNAISKKFKMQENIQAIFFDYLKFPPSQLGQLRSAAEWQMLGFIASGLKDLAGTLEIPIYSACQENRIGSTGKKNEANVGGSDRILQLASKLVFLQNKSEEDIMKEGIINGNQTLYIAYQRNGESDVKPINLMFEKEILTQREVI